jgi:hypothetical protein
MPTGNPSPGRRAIGVSPDVDAAARRLFDAETALREALQTHVDHWICAAYDRLTNALDDYRACVVAIPSTSA